MTKKDPTIRMPEPEYIEPPKTIKMNGVLYGKISEFLDEYDKTHEEIIKLNLKYNLSGEQHTEYNIIFNKRKKELKERLKQNG